MGCVLGVWWRSWICLADMLWPYVNIISHYNKDQPVNSSQRCMLQQWCTRLVRFLGGMGGWEVGGGIGMGGLSKVCSLLNPQVFQIFRIPSLACCLFQTQLQPTTHPFLQHGRLFHMQITSQGLCLALSGGPLNGTCGTPDISGLMHVTEVSACLFQWW